MEQYFIERKLKYVNRDKISPLFAVTPSYFKEWLAGFIEAEGCFSKYKLTPTSLYNTVSFDISQTNQLEIIKAIKIREK